MLLTNPESGAVFTPHPAGIRAAGNPDTKHGVKRQRDALSPVTCWRAPSIVPTHLGCLMECLSWLLLLKLPLVSA